MSEIREVVRLEDTRKTDEDKDKTDKIDKGDRLDKSFDIKVHLVLKMDLALALADFILQERCQNKALLAMAHQIEGK